MNAREEAVPGKPARMDGLPMSGAVLLVGESCPGSRKSGGGKAGDVLSPLCGKSGESCARRGESARRPMKNNPARNLGKKRVACTKYWTRPTKQQRTMRDCGTTYGGDLLMHVCNTSQVRSFEMKTAHLIYLCSPPLRALLQNNELHHPRF